jgi:adenylate cyclase
MQPCVPISSARRGSSDYVLAVQGDTDATFLFADIAGFTALTEAHGDEQAVALVEHFADAVGHELPPIGGEHVKSVGDALMVRVPAPGDAIRLGLRITHGLIRGHEAPAVRVGLNHGSAVKREGDYFGSTVNIAARVSALAAGGEVLLTGNTAALAPDLEDVLYESRVGRACGTSPSRWRYSRPSQCRSTQSSSRSTRSVKWAVDPPRAVGRLMHDHTPYFFCSLTCAAAFAQHPERYAP